MISTLLRLRTLWLKYAIVKTTKKMCHQLFRQKTVKNILIRWFLQKIFHNKNKMCIFAENIG
jgi:hypothetical protein